MPWTNAKRFYADAGFEAAPGGFRVTLDGRPLKTPGGRSVSVPSEALAAAIAEEWAAQGEELKPDSMPLTCLACTAIDRIATDRPAIVEHVNRYGGTDLLCYRADAPPALARRQEAAWQPLLDWAAEALGARLRVTAGVRPVDQTAGARRALRDAVEGLDDLRLAALSAATQASGSLVIGLALVHGQIDPEAAADAAHLDGRWQSEKWGEDGGDRRRRRGIAAEIEAAARLVALVGEPADGGADKSLGGGAPIG